MSVEAITDTIHEYMYEKMNESKDSEEERKIKHVDRKRTYQKPEKKHKTNSEKKTVSDAGHQTGTNHMIVRQRQKSA